MKNFLVTAAEIVLGVGIVVWIILGVFMEDAEDLGQNAHDKYNQIYDPLGYEVVEPASVESDPLKNYLI